MLVGEGKTKELYTYGDDDRQIIVRSKSDLTKNDNSDETRILDGKAVAATTTTCRVFELLKAGGIPVAYDRQLSDTEFLADWCNMIPLEVVMRRYAVGSYLKRYPSFQKEAGVTPYRFHRLVFEIFLKTTGGKLLGLDGLVLAQMPKDALTGRYVEDPFIENPEDSIWKLCHPKIPGWESTASLGVEITRAAVLPQGVSIERIEEIARKTFLILENAWAQQQGCRLIDFKIELGVTRDGKLCVADVIDNDSWRLRTHDWREISKEIFRQNAGMDEIKGAYEFVAKLVERFYVPRQAIVLWRGSDKDDAFDFPGIPGVTVLDVVASGHKSPMRSLCVLERVLAEYPEGGVILAMVGMSNSLGPMLAARTSWPVIAVPLTVKSQPHDVWSSLALPSNVPLTTVLSPGNAFLSALNILAQKNPIASMVRQCSIESFDE